MRRWTTLASLALGTSLGLLLGEMVARVGLHAQVARSHASWQATEWQFFRYDSLLGWANRPGADGWFSMPDSRTHVHIDSVGARDPEHSVEPRRGRRVLVLGDSFTWGYGIEEGLRYTDNLRRELGDSVEVIDTGVSGYGTDQELLAFERDWRRFRPDIVVLEFGVEDFLNNRSEVMYGHAKPYFVRDGDSLALRNVPVPRPDPGLAHTIGFDMPLYVEPVLSSEANPARIVRMKHWLRTHSAIARLVAEVVYHRRDPAAGPIASDSIVAPGEETALLLRRLRRDVEGSGGEFVVMTIPYRDHMSVGATDPQWRGLVLFLSENGFHLLDLRPAFVSATREGQRLYFDIDSHWNSRGHQLAAQLLGQYLAPYIARPGGAPGS